MSVLEAHPVQVRGRRGAEVPAEGMLHGADGDGRGGRDVGDGDVTVALSSMYATARRSVAGCASRRSSMVGSRRASLGKPLSAAATSSRAVVRAGG
ncbi:hypothetical protein [Dactylosporangium matsuzakiense]|uniref:hypothetical protein n=1 Tax=Dactylosporangium matsuzakiense TaxID=53360 RepID=UPI0021C43B83|nr:hypothetical protein [Dactylosporangium matsuzakiense]UWZ50234.1 hypothetical protein Dmats_39255 [Dactylosporangium matsuzakiense]